MAENPAPAGPTAAEDLAAISAPEETDRYLGRMVSLRIARVSRAEAVALSLQAAGRDRDFLKHVGRADRLRDTRRWGEAEYWYWRGIRLYPLHHGYVVQYAHMLKEQGKLPDAEYFYRNALALGAPAEETAIHLRAVYTGDADPLVLPVPLRPDAAVFDLPPLGSELEQIGELFFGHAVDRLADILPVMRRAPTQGAAIEQMLRSIRFANANRDLLELLGHRARAGGL